MQVFQGGDNASEKLQNLIKSGTENAGQTVMSNVLNMTMKNKNTDLPI